MLAPTFVCKSYALRDRPNCAVTISGRASTALLRETI
jgi:hypothetical protein